MSVEKTVDGRRVTVIVIEEEGPRRGQCVVLSGIARQRGGEVFLDRGASFSEVRLPEGTPMRRVASDVSGVFGEPEYTVLLPASSFQVPDMGLLEDAGLSQAQAG